MSLEFRHNFMNDKDNKSRRRWREGDVPARPVRSFKGKDGVSLTKQSFKKSCDVNHILREAVKTGAIGVRSGGQGGISLINAPDLQTAMNRMIAAQRHFDALPKDIKKRFDGSFEKMMEFVADPANKDECIKMGIFKAPEVPKPVEPTPVRIVSDEVKK